MRPLHLPSFPKTSDRPSIQQDKSLDSLSIPCGASDNQFFLSLLDPPETRMIFLPASKRMMFSQQDKAQDRVQIGVVPSRTLPEGILLRFIATS